MGSPLSHQNDGRRARDRGAAVLIFAVLFGIYAYFLPRWGDWSQNARLDLTRALVEQHSLAIDSSRANTGDYIVRGGHVYADVAPGTSALAVPAYLLFRALARTAPVAGLLQRVSHSPAFGDLTAGGPALDEQIFLAAALYAVCVLTVALPAAALGVLLFLSMRPVLPAVPARALLTLAYGLGTGALPYSSMLYGHQIAALLIFSAWVLVDDIRRGHRSAGVLWLAGALCGAAALTETAAVLALLPLSIFALGSSTRRTGLATLLSGAVPFVALAAWYNSAVLGSILGAGYEHGTDAVASSSGFAIVMDAWWGVTFGVYRGLFSLSPFLVLALPGWWYALAARGAVRAAAITWLAVVMLQLMLVCSSADWRAGATIGPRNLLLIVPFLVLPAAVCIAAWRRSTTLRAGAWLLVIASLALTWTAATGGQEPAPITIAFPLRDFFWPKLRAGDVARNLGMVLGLRGWWTLWPLAAAAVVILWLIYQDLRQPASARE